MKLAHTTIEAVCFSAYLSNPHDQGQRFSPILSRVDQTQRPIQDNPETILMNILHSQYKFAKLRNSNRKRFLPNFEQSSKKCGLKCGAPLQLLQVIPGLATSSNRTSSNSAKTHQATWSAIPDICPPHVVELLMSM